jgi:hypothetical protein
MSKRQLIDEIRRFNVTAQIDFLDQFDEEALKEYLERLEGAVNKRLRYGKIAPTKPTKFRMVS